MPIDAGLAGRIVAGRPGPGERWHPEYPFADELDALRPFLANRSAPHPVFRLYQVVEAASGLAVGGIGFFGPPDIDGLVEVGYGLVPSARGRGLASGALAGMLDLAGAHGARIVLAETEETNLPSIRLLQRAGFARTDVGRFERALGRAIARLPEDARRARSAG